MITFIIIINQYCNTLLYEKYFDENSLKKLNQYSCVRTIPINIYLHTHP